MPYPQSRPRPSCAARSQSSRQADPRAAAYDGAMARIGLLTGGGDCPGLNPVIRAIVRKGIDTYGHELYGFRKG